jgi:hypothetical protein
MEDEQGYSPIFYVMLLVGIVGIVGFLCTGSALVGGM